MHQATLFAVLVLFVIQCYGSVQLQMPEAAELHEPEDDLQAQVQQLQKNVTAIWHYIYELRSAVSHHLTHLRQHQVDLETSMHQMEHLHESELQSAAHHHSGEQHSHSGEHHSHTDDEHSHGSDHTHGSMEGHSHTDEHHSHSGEHHHHDDEHGHHSHSYSHSHTSHDHSKEDSNSHGSHDDHHDHKDSHETEDLQQTMKVDPVAEPIVTATTRQEHYHHHHSHQIFSSDSMNLLNEHDHHHHHHDHRHDSSNTGRNRTVVLPKYSEYGLYDLAMCRVQPNSALPEDQKQNIFGTITMWQKKTGGLLNFHVKLQGFEMGDHHAHHQQSIQTEEDNETPQPMSHTHGFHVHASADFSNGCNSAGPHFNPKGVNHGGPNALVRHVGDLGNIACDEHGQTNIVFGDDIASLRGQYSIIGKSIVIHAKEDDIGLGGDAESLKTGNAGTRLACCVIQSVDKIPIRQYKSMKIATQRNN